MDKGKLVGSARFQFQCGAIRSNLVTQALGGKTEFQFQCGAIRRIAGKNNAEKHLGVSIPVWCD